MLDLNNIQVPEVPEVLEKKRGRKKKEKPIELDKIEVKKKRGRKKKWEIETTSKILSDTPVIFNTTNKIINSNENYLNNNENNNDYEQQDISFGNLNIKIHTNKDIQNTTDILYNLKNNLDNKTNLDYHNKCNDVKLKEKNIQYKTIKIITHYNSINDNGKQIYLSNIRCYNCHHTFKNEPYFLPTSYCDLTKRYKIMGNFCSPNCVKKYSNLYNNKNSYLVSHMYKQIFGYTYTIKAAPNIQLLKEYGGTLSIEEYRNTFNTNTNYSLKHINTKIIYDEMYVK